MTAVQPDTLEPGSDAVLDGLASSTARRNTVTVRTVRVDGSRFVAKVATGRCRAQLRVEAEVLTHLGDVGPTVVALREHDERTDLILEDLGGRNLADLPSMDLTERIRALRRSAQAIDRLHRAGWSHGAVCAEHIAVDARGSVRLCSFGSARPLGADPTLAADDLGALVQIVRRCADMGRPVGTPRSTWTWARRQLRRLDRTLDERDRSGMLDARELSSELASIEDRLAAREAAGRTLTSRCSSAGRRCRTVAAPLGSASILVATIVFALHLGDAGLDQLEQDRRPAPIRPASDVAPRCASPDGCDVDDAPEVRIGDVTVRVGEPGDLPAVPADECGPAPVLVLLRPSTGEVFAFDRLATPARPVDARLVGVVDGATRIDPPSAPLCRPLVHDRSGTTQAISTEQDDPP